MRRTKAFCCIACCPPKLPPSTLTLGRQSHYSLIGALLCDPFCSIKHANVASQLRLATPLSSLLPLCSLKWQRRLFWPHSLRALFASPSLPSTNLNQTHWRQTVLFSTNRTQLAVGGAELRIKRPSFGKLNPWKGGNRNRWGGKVATKGKKGAERKGAKRVLNEKAPIVTGNKIQATHFLFAPPQRKEGARAREGVFSERKTAGKRR